jgi:hypothetical protein
VIRARRARVDTAAGGSALIVRVILLGALVLGAMIAIKDGRLLRDAGLIGSCSQYPSVSGDQVFWQACRKGRLDGRPDLSVHGCRPVTIRNGVEWWSCPASLSSGRAAT